MKLDVVCIDRMGWLFQYPNQYICNLFYLTWKEENKSDGTSFYIRYWLDQKNYESLNFVTNHQKKYKNIHASIDINIFLTDLYSC